MMISTTDQLVRRELILSMSIEVSETAEISERGSCMLNEAEKKQCRFDDMRISI